MWYLFILVIATLLSGSLERTLEKKSPEHGGTLTKDRNWLWNGRSNGVRKSSRLTAKTYDVNSIPSLATKQCTAGNRWSKSKQKCVEILGLTKAGGNSRRSGMKCAPGRRWSQRQRKCLLRSGNKKTSGTGQKPKKISTKGLTSSIGSRPKPPPRGPSYGNQIGKK